MKKILLLFAVAILLLGACKKDNCKNILNGNYYYLNQNDSIIYSFRTNNELVLFEYLNDSIINTINNSYKNNCSGLSIGDIYYNYQLTDKYLEISKTNNGYLHKLRLIKL